MIHVTLLTRHKGVDLHAASAAQVIRGRLAGGERLLRLARAEFRAFEAHRCEDETAGVAALLASGRCYNPNKHWYGHFRVAALGKPWHESDCRGGPLPPAWPGEPAGTSWGAPDDGLCDRLLGGEFPSAGAEAFDVVAFGLGRTDPPLAGVVWRLVIAAGDPAPAVLADRLVVARSAREGLLVNPHLQGWLISPSRARGDTANAAGGSAG